MRIPLRFENGASPILYVPLLLPGVAIKSAYVDEDGYHILVESTAHAIQCRICGNTIRHFHGYGRPITLRHLPILGHPVFITLRPKRFLCPECSSQGHTVITTQTLDWQVPRSPLTRPYEDHVLLQLVNNTIEDVSRKEGLPYDTVLGLLERRIAAQVNWEEFSELPVIGIDEIARRKGHRDFLTLITTRTATGETRLLAVLPDRKKETVKAFLDSIPSSLRRTIRTVCVDMWDGFVSAVRESLGSDPQCAVEIVIDRFHVAEEYHEAADDLRKAEMKRLKQELPRAEYQELRHTMWLFRRRWQSLNEEEKARLERLFQYSPILRQAHQLREQLTEIFDTAPSPEEAAIRLEEWIQAVLQSGLTCFQKFIATLRRWWNEILNYFHQRWTSAFVEGLNNRVKVLKRRCYGLLNVVHFSQRLYLDLEGYRLFARIPPYMT